MPATSAQTLTIRATVDSPDPQTNTATIAAADQSDPNPGNNTGVRNRKSAARRPGAPEDGR